MKRRVEINILPGFYIYMSIMLLLLPFPWLCAALLAGLLHELGHITAIKAMGVSISQITLQGAGARIHTSPMGPGQELLCAAAGPASGILLLILFPIFPKLAFCGLLQTAFNLLPVHFFDGARITRAIAVLLLGDEKGERVFNGVKCASAVLLGAGCLMLIRFNAIASALGILFLVYSVKKGRTQHLTNLPGVIN